MQEANPTVTNPLTFEPAANTPFLGDTGQTYKSSVVATAEELRAGETITADELNNTLTQMLSGKT